MCRAEARRARLKEISLSSHPSTLPPSWGDGRGGKRNPRVKALSNEARLWDCFPWVPSRNPALNNSAGGKRSKENSSPPDKVILSRCKGFVNTT